MCLQDGFIQVSFVVITIFANQRGLTDAAAVGIVEKIISILFLVPSSMMSTISALVAQNIGAGKHDRAKLTLKICADDYGDIWINYDDYRTVCVSSAGRIIYKMMVQLQ